MKALTRYLLMICLMPVAMAAETVPLTGLDGLIGNWEGTGWTQQGPDRRETFESREVVRKVLGGSALLIEGEHFKATEKGRIPVHQALALVRADGEGNYRLHSWLSNGRDIEAWGRMVGEEFHWGFTLPDGSRQIRYRLLLQGDTWTETGETSVDGEHWVVFFGMSLQRISGIE